MGAKVERQLISIRLPKEVIKELDRLLSKTGKSRNEFIAEATAMQLARLQAAEKVQRLHGVLQPEDVPAWAESSVKWVRAVRKEEGEKLWAT